jgi:hypothetical protein
MVQSRVTRRPNIVTTSGSEPIGDDGALLSIGELRVIGMGKAERSVPAPSGARWHVSSNCGDRREVPGIG